MTSAGLLKGEGRQSYSGVHLRLDTRYCQSIYWSVALIIKGPHCPAALVPT